MGDIGVRRDIVVWRARRLLASEDEDWDLPDRRRAVGVFIAAALVDSGPFDEGLRFVQAAHRLAPARATKAHALLLPGRFHTSFGELCRHA
jgi:hypothetical protein